MDSNVYVAFRLFSCVFHCKRGNASLKAVKSLQQWEIRPLRRVRVTWQILIQLVCLVWKHSNKNKNLYFHTDHLDLYGTVFPEGRENDFFPQQFAISSSPGPYIEICPIGLTKVNPRLISELKPGIHSYNIWLKKNVIIEARWEKKNHRESISLFLLKMILILASAMSSQLMGIRALLSKFLLWSLPICDFRVLPVFNTPSYLHS